MKCLKMEVKDGVAIARMDDPDFKVNALSAQMIADFEKAISRIESDSSIKAAVLISGMINHHPCLPLLARAQHSHALGCCAAVLAASDKKDCFITGADVGMLSACKTAAEAEAISKNGHALFKRVEKGKPIVAAINGSCLGGGLETALPW